MRILDGPPFTNGQIHIGTAYNKILKDVLLRISKFKGMQSYIRYGWDMHGLPIELKIQPDKSKVDNINSFLKSCATFANTNLDNMKKEFNSLNLLFPLKEEQYKTHSRVYYNTVWSVFSQLYSKGLIYRNKAIVNWCKSCETSLANSEIISTDELIKEFYFFVDTFTKYKLLICTTTFWTLPLNKFITYNKNLEYVVIEINNFKVICSINFAKKNNFKFTPLDIDLEELKYKRFDINETNFEKAYKLYHADFVTDVYTGLVHIAPEHGIDDLNFAKRLNYPVNLQIDTKGNYLFDCDIKQYEKLIHTIKNSENKVHVCWRCKTPIINIVSNQWFVNISSSKTLFLENLEKLNLSKIHKSNMENWIKNAHDWCISRQRYWGIPLPVWINDKKEVIVFNSIDELERICGLELQLEDIYGLNFIFNGVKYTHIKEIFDVWFESGCAFINLNELSLDTVIEAHDQIRGFFYSLLVLNSLMYNELKLKKIVVHGFIMQNKKEKFSKSKGNVLNLENIEDLRTFLLTKPIGEDFIFNIDELQNIKNWNNLYRHTIKYLEYTENLVRKTNRDIEIVNYLDNYLINLVNSIKNIPENQAQLHKYWISFKNCILDISRKYIKYIKKPVKYIDLDNYEKHIKILKQSAQMLHNIYSIFTGVIETKQYFYNLNNKLYNFDKVFDLISSFNELKQKNNISLTKCLQCAYIEFDLEMDELKFLTQAINVLEIRKGTFGLNLNTNQNVEYVNTLRDLIKKIQLKRTNLNLDFSTIVNIQLNPIYNKINIEDLEIETNSKVEFSNVEDFELYIYQNNQNNNNEQ